MQTGCITSRAERGARVQKRVDRASLGTTHRELYTKLYNGYKESIEWIIRIIRYH